MEEQEFIEKAKLLGFTDQMIKETLENYKTEKQTGIYLPLEARLIEVPTDYPCNN